MAEWYYAKNNQKHGPISEALLVELAGNGTLQPDDLVWTEELNEWIKAEEVEGLKFHKSPPPLPGAAPSGRAQAVTSASRQVVGRSNLAVTSLVFGVLSPLLLVLAVLCRRLAILLEILGPLAGIFFLLSFLTGGSAIICGQRARARIAAARGTLTGKGMALTGPILGCVPFIIMAAVMMMLLCRLLWPSW